MGNTFRNPVVNFGKYMLYGKHWTKKKWLGVVFGVFLYIGQRPEHYENSSGSIWRALKCGAGWEWRRKTARKMTNEEVLECVGGKKTLIIPTQ